MRRLVVFLAISCLFLGQGFSVAAAVCQHRSAHDHALARVSRDVKVSEAAHTEDTAAAVAEKKGASLSSSLSMAVAVLAKDAAWVSQRHSGYSLPWPRMSGPETESSTVIPLLRPPAAL